MAEHQNCHILQQDNSVQYRGRIAPTPTGFLHLGHAATFYRAYLRTKEFSGKLILRIEDIDKDRCKPEFTTAILEDLHWLGIHWDEGPDIGGPFDPYTQSQRQTLYKNIWNQLKKQGYIYPCTKSRKDVQTLASAPHDATGDLIFTPDLRPDQAFIDQVCHQDELLGYNWRFKVPENHIVRFIDKNCGPQEYKAFKDFGDFLIYRKDGTPAYELAVVVDDHFMEISEVVRGEDLLASTARQILLYEVLGWNIPSFYHTPLVKDAQGVRLAKRNDAFSLANYRNQGISPQELLSQLKVT